MTSHLKCLQILCFSILILCGIRPDSQANELDPVPSALSPQPSVTLKGHTTLWRQRAFAWYTSNDTIERRKQMREMSRPMKRPCYYCHTRSFKGYVDSTYLISLQMMAISAEQDVKCKDCHQGQRGLSELGAKSLIQWRYSAAQQKDCSDCHQSKGQFKKLTKEGQASIPLLIQDLEKGKYLDGIPRQITDQFLEQLRKVGQENSNEYLKSLHDQKHSVEINRYEQ